MARSNKKTVKAVMEVPKKIAYTFVFLALLGMGGAFLLGLWVGRGTAPIHFDVEDMRQELIALKADLLRRQAEDREEGGPADSIIYDHLSGANDDLLFDPEIPEDEEPGAGPIPPAPEPEKPLVPEPAKVPEKKPEPLEEARTGDSATGPWTVQVAAVYSEKDAGRVVDKWGKLGYAAYWVEVPREGKSTLYRVRVGRFATRDEARAENNKIRKHEKNSFVIKNK